LEKYYAENPRLGCMVCTYDKTWEDPKCCMEMWPYEQGLRLLMCILILEFPGTVWEAIKLKD